MEGQAAAAPGGREDFSSLMAMGTEYVSAYLAGHPTKIQPCILQQLEAMPIDHSLRLALWSLCGGSPVPVIKEIQRKTEGKSNVCALVWKPGKFLPSISHNFVHSFVYHRGYCLQLPRLPM